MMCNGERFQCQRPATFSREDLLQSKLSGDSVGLVFLAQLVGEIDLIVNVAYSRCRGGESR
jgi:hypothetical protein